MRLSEISDLPMDAESRMARAKEMGFTVPAYHGTGTKFDEFDLEKGKPSIMGGFGPHFADDHSESRGYAKEVGRKGRVLHVLLRIKKPFPAMVTDTTKISLSDYKKLLGREPEKANDLLGKQVLYELEKEFGWSDHKALWVNIYKRLKSAGFDALVYRGVLSDYSNSGTYTKFVILDPKNIRSIRAAFNPSKSDSSDLMA